LRHHEFVFVGADRVDSLARHGFATVDIPMIGNVYAQNRVDLTGTIRGAVSALNSRARVFDRLDAVIRDFDPDLILTDYEYFVARAARRAGRPCISVDRQHFLTNCRYPKPQGAAVGRALSLGAMRAFQMAADRYFVISFTPAVPNGREDTEVFPPVLRREIRSLEAQAGEAALVYLYASSVPWIRKAFGGRKRRFIVYGHDREGEEGNLVFRRHDPDRFAAELAQAAYVVCHAGSNLIAESLHLRKPLLTFPIALHYEQHINAHLLAEAGYGAYGASRRGAASVEAFEASLADHRARLAGYRPWSERSVVSRLEGLLGGSRTALAEAAALDSDCFAVQQ
jgi:uncharacterized protein (TIGR00661 family)